jgi:hypothetical protein
VPHSPQNFMPAAFTVPHVGQAAARGVPHSPQNFLPASLAKPQTGQFISCHRRGVSASNGEAVNGGV